MPKNKRTMKNKRVGKRTTRYNKHNGSCRCSLCKRKHGGCGCNSIKHGGMPSPLVGSNWGAPVSEWPGVAGMANNLKYNSLNNDNI